MAILAAKDWEDVFITPDDSAYELLEALQCPDHLDELDLDNDEVCQAFEEVHHEELLLHLEQACDADGRLLSRELGLTRLQNAPWHEIRKLEAFMNSTDEYILGQVAYFVFWLVRLDRASEDDPPVRT